MAVHRLHHRRLHNVLHCSIVPRATLAGACEPAWLSWRGVYAGTTPHVKVAVRCHRHPVRLCPPCRCADMELRVGKKYRLGKKIGSGSFGGACRWLASCCHCLPSLTAAFKNPTRRFFSSPCRTFPPHAPHRRCDGTCACRAFLCSEPPMAIVLLTVRAFLGVCSAFGCRGRWCAPARAVFACPTQLSCELANGLISHVPLPCGDVDTALLPRRADIYLGTNVSTGEEVAMKLESTKSKHPQLVYEAKLYKILQGAVGECNSGCTRVVPQVAVDCPCSPPPLC